MPPKRIQVNSFGPIGQLDLALGDLNVLVGPQASGKSLFLQCVKAFEDMDDVVTVLKRHGYQWPDISSFLELFFGEGMGGLIGPGTKIYLDGKEWAFKEAADRSWSKHRRKDTRVFYIPAQRVLTLLEGWPRPFTAFHVGAPFVVKQFSEDVRRLLEPGLGGDALFPAERRMKREIRKLLADAIFHGASVRVDDSRLRKQIVLSVGQQDSQLPFMSWSAGQREFIPLMLGLYWLMPTQATPRRGTVSTAIIEEPEMGLHPQAISALALAILDLLKRGYRVFLSTHSPHVLELVWALEELRHSDEFVEFFCELFDVPSTGAIKELASAVSGKSMRVHYFYHRTEGGVATKDISSLDPAAEDEDIAQWGGLTEFAERATNLVARWAARS